MPDTRSTKRRSVLWLLVVAVALLPIPLELLAAKKEYDEFLGLRARRAPVGEYEHLLGAPVRQFRDEGGECREFQLGLFSGVVACSAAESLEAEVVVLSSDFRLTIENSWKLMARIYERFYQRHLGDCH
ncbi:MAG: hypothetical protein GY720_16770 [bacterium]|nr:hypothetical protein [bacterium]